MILSRMLQDAQIAAAAEEVRDHANTGTEGAGPHAMLGIGQGPNVDCCERGEAGCMEAVPGTNSRAVNAEGEELREILDRVACLDVVQSADARPIIDGCVMWRPEAMLRAAELTLLEATEKDPLPSGGPHPGNCRMVLLQVRSMGA